MCLITFSNNEIRETYETYSAFTCFIRKRDRVRRTAVQQRIVVTTAAPKQCYRVRVSKYYYSNQLNWHITSILIYEVRDVICYNIFHGLYRSMPLFSMKISTQF